MNTSYFFSRLVAGMAILLSLSASAFAAGTPAQIAISSGSQQTGVVGTALPSQFVARVTDANGKVVAGAQVDWVATDGGGWFQTGSTYTNASGLAGNTLTLGRVSGFNKATATIHNQQRLVIFGATGNPGTAQTIAVSSGNGQTGTVGAPVPAGLTVICRDQYGNPSSHAQIDWAVTAGGGSFVYPYSVTVGGVSSKSLTLGTVPGVDQATATIHGTGKTVGFVVYAKAGPVAQIVVQGGNSQTGSSGAWLASPLTVAVKDAYGNARSGITVTWSAKTAGDGFSTSSVATNASGLASSSLKLGSGFGLHRAVATVSAANLSMNFTATVGMNALVTMATSSSQNAKALRPYFLGLSYQKDWITVPLFNAQNQALISLFKKLGPGVLRIVAERPLVPVPWDHDGPGLQYGRVSKADLVRLEGFLQATNWKILYGIALVGNKANCAAGQTECAADEAQVAAGVFGSNLLGFEVGNEPDQYQTAVYGNPAVAQIAGYSFEDYISTKPVYANGGLLPSWPAFADAIHAAAPNAALTGPSAGIAWVLPFAESSQASRVSLLTRHFYHVAPTVGTPTLVDLLTTDPRIAYQFPQMAQAATAAGISGGFRVSECNSFTSPVPGVTNAFGAALWTIEFLFANAFNQSSGVNFHGGADVMDDFSPIHDNGTNVVGIGPDYYGMLAYAQIMQGGKLLATTVTQGPNTFSAHSVQEPDGSTDVILSNKDSFHNVTVGVQRSGTSEARSLLLTAPSIRATSGFTFGQAGVNVDGSWDAVSNPSWPIIDNIAVVTVPSGSAQVIHLR